MVKFTTCWLLATIGVARGLAVRNNQQQKQSLIRLEASISRRDVVSSVLAGTIALPLVLTSPREAGAFSNKISDKFDDRPKRRGPKPKDLGIAKRVDMGGEEYQGLKNCGPAPNCFCSTDNQEDEPEHWIPAWNWPKDYDQERAFKELEEVIRAYKPGQGNIDGGGFEIQRSDAKSGYLYVQFEALKNGYIDDLELAVVPGRDGLQVRSSSRVGYLDFGVNAKRLNYITEALRGKGWDAVGVDLKTHPDYAGQNGLS